MIVLDASVALKWILETELYRDKAQEIHKNHVNKKQEIIVPSFFFIEIANSLVTKTFTKKETIEKNLKFIYGSNLSIHESSSRDILLTSQLAKKYTTSVYDMLYAVVAKRHKTILITADRKFIEKTKFRFVKHIAEI